MTEKNAKPTLAILMVGLSHLDGNAIEGLLVVELQGVTGFLDKQTTKFLAKAPESIKQFQAEIADSNFALARETIHKLAGYAGMVGAASIRVLGLAIESEIDSGNHSKAAELSRSVDDVWQKSVLDFEKLLQRLKALPPKN